MQVQWKRSALVVGVIGLAVAAGAVWSLGTGRAFADENEREFTGVVEARPVTDVGVWRIAGQNVVVTVETEIDHNGQTLGPGTRVEVDGTAQPDGSILAKEIEVETDGDSSDDDDGGTTADDDDDDGNGSGLAASSGDNDNSSGAVARDDDDGAQQLLPVGTRHGDDDDDD